MEKISTVKLSVETKSRLNKLKLHKRESYEDVMRRILEILNICRANPFQARAKLDEIDKIISKVKQVRELKDTKGKTENKAGV